MINGITVGTGKTSVLEGGVTAYPSNTALGWVALASNLKEENTAVGYYALANNVNGERNTAIGSRAMIGADDILTEGATRNHNTVVGASTLTGLLSGDKNTGIGYYALSQLKVGNRNTALGQGTLEMLRNGSENIAIGSSTMYGHATDFNADGNIAIGRSGLVGISTGSYNIGVGWNVIPKISTGDHNVGIGYQALPTLTTGSKNIALGYQSNNTLTTQEQTIAIGNEFTFATGNYGVAIGNGTATNSETKATGANAVAIGTRAFAGTENSVTVGPGATTSRGWGEGYATALGSGTAAGPYSVAIGTSTTSGVGLYSNVAMGNNAQILAGGSSISMGNKATVATGSGNGNIALGWFSHVGGTNSISIGSSTVGTPASTGIVTVKGENSVGVGTEVNVLSDYSIGVGYKATAASGSGISIGNAAAVLGTSSLNGVAIGTTSRTSAANGVSIGNAAAVLGTSSLSGIAIGTTATTSSSNGIAIGTTSKTSALNGIAIGTASESSAANSIAIGNGAAIGVPDYTVLKNRSTTIGNLLSAGSNPVSNLTLQLVPDVADLTTPDGFILPRLLKSEIINKGNLYKGNVNDQHGALVYVTSYKLNEGIATGKEEEITKGGIYAYNAFITNGDGVLGKWERMAMANEIKAPETRKNIVTVGAAAGSDYATLQAAYNGEAQKLYAQSGGLFWVEFQCTGNVGNLTADGTIPDIAITGTATVSFLTITKTKLLLGEPTNTRPCKLTVTGLGDVSNVNLTHTQVTLYKDASLTVLNQMNLSYTNLSSIYTVNIETGGMTVDQSTFKLLEGARTGNSTFTAQDGITCRTGDIWFMNTTTTLNGVATLNGNSTGTAYVLGVYQGGFVQLDKGSLTLAGTRNYAVYASNEGTFTSSADMSFTGKFSTAVLGSATNSHVQLSSGTVTTASGSGGFVLAEDHSKFTISGGNAKMTVAAVTGSAFRATQGSSIAIDGGSGATITVASCNVVLEAIGSVIRVVDYTSGNKLITATAVLTGGFALKASKGGQVYTLGQVTYPAAAVNSPSTALLVSGLLGVVRTMDGSTINDTNSTGIIKFGVL